MSYVTCQMKGRFGNQAMIYLFTRAYAEHHSLEFRCPEWIGEKIFEVSHPRPPEEERYIFDERDVNGTWPPSHADYKGIEFRGYAQMQHCMLYTKRDAQKWLRFRPEIFEAMSSYLMPKVIGHVRHGDYTGYGYATISKDSYIEACDDFGIDRRLLQKSSEEDPYKIDKLEGDLAFVPDFYRLTHARILLRANSSFSWLAALLGNGLVLSPVIDGLEGGKEHHVKFVAGNHPRFTNLPFVEDLYVAP